MAKVITQTDEFIFLEDDGGFVTVIEKDPLPSLGSVLGIGLEDDE